MKAFEAMRKPPVMIDADATIRSAAALMDEHAVGALVVMDGTTPVGIVTDRDIVVRGTARDLPPEARVDGVMTMDLVTLDADADLRDALPLFRSHAIRRLPLIRDGALVGMIAVDDLLVDLVADLGDVVRPIAGEVIFGHPEAQLPATAG